MSIKKCSEVKDEKDVCSWCEKELPDPCLSNPTFAMFGYFFCCEACAESFVESK